MKPMPLACPRARYIGGLAHFVFISQIMPVTATSMDDASEVFEMLRFLVTMLVSFFTGCFCMWMFMDYPNILNRAEPKRRTTRPRSSMWNHLWGDESHATCPALREGRHAKSHRKLWAWTGNSEELCPSDEGCKRDWQARCRKVSCRSQEGHTGVGRERAPPYRKQRTMWWTGTKTMSCRILWIGPMRPTTTWMSGTTTSWSSTPRSTLFVKPPSSTCSTTVRLWVVDACKTHCHAQVLNLRGSQSPWKLWAGSFPTRMQVMADRFLSEPPLVFNVYVCEIQVFHTYAGRTGIFPLYNTMQCNVCQVDWSFPTWRI